MVAKEMSPSKYNKNKHMKNTGIPHELTAHNRIIQGTPQDKGKQIDGGF